MKVFILFLIFLHLSKCNRKMRGGSVQTSYQLKLEEKKSHCAPFNQTERAVLSQTLTTNSVQCGDVFECKSGTIFYKPLETILPNERCIWIIGVPKATGYTLKFSKLAQIPSKNGPEEEDSDSAVIVSAFLKGRAPTHFRLSSSSASPAKLVANVLLVTFYSGSDSQDNFGFILQYSTTFAENVSTTQTRSRHHLIGPEEYFIKHPDPVQSKYYYPGEMSFFVFLPRNNIYNPSKEGKVVWMKNSMYCCQYDWLKVYKFDVTCADEHKWVFQGRICAENNITMVCSAEPILFVFESTMSEGGFQFSYHA